MQHLCFSQEGSSSASTGRETSKKSTFIGHVAGDWPIAVNCKYQHGAQINCCLYKNYGCFYRIRISVVLFLYFIIPTVLDKFCWTNMRQLIQLSADDLQCVCVYYNFSLETSNSWMLLHHEKFFQMLTNSELGWTNSLLADPEEVFVKEIALSCT